MLNRLCPIARPGPRATVPRTTSRESQSRITGRAEAPITELDGEYFVAFTQDGRTLVAGSGNSVDGGTLQFIDVATRKVRESVPCSHSIRCLAVSADGKSLAVGTWEGVNRKTVTSTPPKLIICKAVP